MKTIQKFLVSILTIISLLFTSQLKAQEEYSYATFEKYDKGSETKFLVISDPIRNWSEMTNDDKENWNASFRTQANRKTGMQLMESYEKGTPYNGSYRAFNSEAKCKEAITEEINEFNRSHKNAYQGGKSSYKVIYVYPSKR